MPMKIAIATKDFRQIAGHAGQSQHWLVYEGTQPGQTLTVKNSDPVSHNVHPQPKNNRDIRYKTLSSR